MTSDDELLKQFRARWAEPAAPAAVTAAAPKKPAGDWTSLVQLNVRIPSHVKKMIEQEAAARGVTLAQLIAAACVRDAREHE